MAIPVPPAPRVATANLMAARVALPSAAFDLYEAQAASLKKPLETLLGQQLERFQAVPLTARVLIIDPATRETIEDLLGTTCPDTPALLAALQKALEVQIESVKVAFTPSQRVELKRRADRNGTTLKAETEKAVAEVAGLVFNGVV